MAHRGVLIGVHNLVCPLFFAQVEDLDHLFLLCSVASRDWLIMLNWIDITHMVSQTDVLSYLIEFYDYLIGKVRKISSPLVVSFHGYLVDEKQYSF